MELKIPNPFKPPKDIYWRHHEGLSWEWTGEEGPVESLVKHIVELIDNLIVWAGFLFFLSPLLIPMGLGWCVAKIVQLIDKTVFRTEAKG